MREVIQISAKNVGSVALPDFCPRCFWMRQRVRNKLPFQIFPGIFSSIDAYTKRVVHGWFDELGAPPNWLADLGDVTGYVDPPHHTKYRFYVDDLDIMLTGSPDGILTMGDASHVIIDYKTARFTATQDKLHPMYETQLNVYAMIGEHRGLAPVSGLALVYAEPVTDDVTASQAANRRPEGFAMPFDVKMLPVTLDAGIVRPLLEKTRAIFDLPSAPVGASGCQDCEKLEALMSVAT